MISNPVKAGTSFLTDTLKVSSSSRLLSLTSKLADKYNASNSGQRIKVVSMQETGKSTDLLRDGNIAIISDNRESAISGESSLKMVIARDVIVPVINAKNPYMDEIRENGVSAENLKVFLSDSKSRNWGILLKTVNDSPASLYYLNDESVSEAMARYLKIDKNTISGVQSESAAQVLSAVRNDKLSIGFCKLANILDPANRALSDNIALLPVDKNGNGSIDSYENIYQDLNAFVRGVWIGKYPRQLISNIYSVSAANSTDESAVSFLKWVLNDGQQYLYTEGYSGLLANERLSNSDNLTAIPAVITADSQGKSIFRTLLIIIAIILVCGFVADFTVKRISSGGSSKELVASIAASIKEESLNLPKGLYFDKTHTWAYLEQDGIVKTGIDDYIQHLTGSITGVVMRNAGDQVKKGEEIMSVIRNGKHLILYSPVSGIIRNKNHRVENDASLLNSSPYDEGWVYRIEPDDWHRENQLLFMADRHRRFIGEELLKLRDFLAAILSSDAGKNPAVILQDGGYICDGALADLDPEIWEEYQSKFIDPSRQVWFYELY